MGFGIRKEAKEAGKKRYFTGKSCPQGHINDRYTSTGRCVICTLNDYKKWLSENIKVQAILSGKWKKLNRKRCRVLDQRWRDANRSQVRAKDKLFYKNNKDLYRSARSKRRARIRGADGSHTKNDLRKLFLLQNGKCACCKLPLGNDYEADHIIPLAKGGANDIFNIQLLRKVCNRKKLAKDPIEFMQEKGMLL